MTLPGTRPRPGNRRHYSAGGFAIRDLIALLGVLALLAVLQLAARAHDKANAHRFICADNLRRLSLSWLMYADDHYDRLAPNGDVFPATNRWVAGAIDYSGTDSTNTATITQARLYPYNKSVGIYRCPDDLSVARGQLRVRSYSMNNWVGDGASAFVSGFQVMTNRSLIRQPDQTFVFFEEHADSINDGSIILVDLPLPGSTSRMLDVPAAYHHYGANVNFADGSVRYRAWLDPLTSPVRVTSFLGPFAPSDPDVVWMQTISTYRK